MEVKNKKWLKHIGQSAVVLLLMGSVVGLLYDGSKGPKAKRSQDRANDRKHQAQHCGCQ